MNVYIFVSSKRLDKVVIRRARRFEDFRKYIVLRAKMYFQMMLSQRGYSGRMKVDHDEEKLYVQVCNISNMSKSL